MGTGRSGAAMGANRLMSLLSRSTRGM
ncbi:hypothetical protein AZE42_12586 [Rhizopogon vesiculosus]|uniref:Uncharacterized protein n=1 Tax=Rhizopogon vesiculosus TaxID=180088 RepID=A0A1J8Q8Z1_9AGAM|nr:hypothetical protein AZE42_12586 [Rhizopogon vesiculosus]